MSCIIFEQPVIYKAFSQNFATAQIYIRLCSLSKIKLQIKPW